MTLAIDGTPQNNSNSTGTITVTITTASSPDLIVADILVNSSTVSSVTASGVTSSNGAGTLARHATLGAAGSNFERWAGTASAALSSVTVTVTDAAATFASINVYAISGANTSSPWDFGGPVLNTGSPADPSSITTTNTNTMVIAGFRMSSQSSPTAGASFTGIALNSNFMLSEYQILGGAQALSCTIGTGSGNSNGSIVDAVIAAAGSGPVATGAAITGIIRVQRGPGWRWRAPPKGYVRRKGLLLKAA